jgi:hypothetical protein
MHRLFVFYSDPQLTVSYRYIEFYLDCVANAENISFLFYLAGKLKTVRDSESQGHSEANAILCLTIV